MSIQIDLELLTKRFEAGVASAVKASNNFSKQFSKNTDKNEKSMQGLAKSINGSSKSISQSFNVATVAAGTFLGNLAFDAVVGGITQATSAIAQLGKESLDAAIDAEETRSKFSTIFKGISSDAQGTADELAKSFGLGSTEARKLLGDTGDLLTGFGFSQKGALDLSQQVQELAVDLASFTNFSGGASGASEALTKALLGERESVKSLGISIQEADVKKQIAINNANGLTFATERQAKAQATLDLAIKQSQNAIGDYARTNDSAANQQRLLTTRLTDLKEAVGRGLIPAFRIALVEINKFVSSIDTQALTDFVKNGVVNVIEGLIGLTTYINPVINGFKLLGNIASLLANSVIASFNIIKTSVQVVITGVVNDVRRLVNAIPDSLLPDGLKESVNDFSDSTRETLGQMAKDTGNSFQDIGKSFDDIGNSFENSISEEGLNKIKNVLTKVKTEVKNAAIEVASIDTKGKTDNSEELRRLQEESDKKLAIKQNETERLRLIEQNKNTELSIINATAKEERNELDNQELLALQDLETKKLQIIRDAALNKLELEKDQQKRLIEINKVNTKFEIESQKLKIKQSKELTAVDKKNKDDNLKDQQSFFSTTARLASSGNQTLIGISKAAALARVAIDTPSAVSSSYRYGTAIGGPILGSVFGGIAAAAMATQASQIVSAGKFETGGIVSGRSNTGDRLTANVNSGEMILNRRQQTELFQQANGSGGGGISADQIASIVQQTVSSMNVTLVANDNEIARSASRGAINGVVIGVSE